MKTILHSLSGVVFMIYSIRQYLEMVRFSHTLFALPFALTAAVMAWSTNLSQTAARRFSMARTAGRCSLHGDCPKCRDVVQSAG